MGPSIGAPPTKAGQRVVDAILSDYVAKTPESGRRDSLAKRSLPGGDTRWSTYYMPYPLYMDRGEKCYVTDVDGHRYLDMQNNYTALVHGHRHPAVLAAVAGQIDRDIIYGAPSESQYRLADLLTARIPGIELVRFTNSGTEATMMAMRTARAFTGRDIILKMDGGYHGSHDFAEVNISPDMSGSETPVARTEADGVPSCVLDAMMVARYNDVRGVEALLEKHAQRIAAIILEPVMNSAGIIPADPAFVRALRELADHYKMLLIFDEIVTLRLNAGGWQAKHDIVPDLTTLGKMIGGGFAIGAFGGRREIMDAFNPARPGGFHHSGTFNGHNLTMAAGAAAVELLTPSEIERIDALTVRLHQGIQAAAESVSIRENTTRAGSLLYLHWSEKPIVSASDVVSWKKRAGDLPRLVHMEMLNRGVFTANRGLMNVSTAMTEDEIDAVVHAFAGTLSRLKPYVEAELPHLMR